MPRRSKVELYEQIRKAQARDGVSIRELARRFGVHRRDVRAALSSPVPPPRKKPVARPAPVLGPWKATIDGWLAADRTAPRKQRHTARRVWQRLVDEHGVDVGESTVRRYVAEVRRRQELPLVEVMVPQHHPLGAEAEVDFGSIHVYVDGLLTELPFFLMRLSASGRGFVHAYLSDAQAFERFGGVPDRVRYDNLKAAVTKVGRGRNRVESERFVALRSHYGFDSFFCQPGQKGAHEKGGVESEVGRFRRRHLVPIPRVGSLAELNVLLAAAMERDDRRHIDHRQITVGEHFALESPA
jgi:transposase